MRKQKEQPKYNVLSMRVTDEEKEIMEALKRKTRKSISALLREAIRLHSPQLQVSFQRK